MLILRTNSSKKSARFWIKNIIFFAFNNLRLITWSTRIQICWKIFFSFKFDLLSMWICVIFHVVFFKTFCAYVLFILVWLKFLKIRKNSSIFWISIFWNFEIFVKFDCNLMSDAEPHCWINQIKSIRNSNIQFTLSMRFDAWDFFVVEII